MLVENKHPLLSIISTVCVPDNKLLITKLEAFSKISVAPSIKYPYGATPSTVLIILIAKLPSWAQLSTTDKVISGEGSKPTTTTFEATIQLLASFT